MRMKIGNLFNHVGNIPSLGQRITGHNYKSQSSFRLLGNVPLFLSPFYPSINLTAKLDKH